MVQYGCSLYSFGFIKVPSFYMFVKACINEMKNNGIKYFELPLWNEFSACEAGNIKTIIGDSESCYAVHLPKAYSSIDILQSADLLEGIHILKPKIAVAHFSYTDNYVYDYSRLNEIFVSYGCQMCLEYLVYEKQQEECITNLLEHLDVGIALDLYHCANAKKVPENIINEYGVRIKHVHFNDYSKSVPKSVCPGRGDLALEEYVIALSKYDYEGVYMLECNFGSEGDFREILDYCRNIKDI